MSNRICGRCKSSVVVPWNNVKDFYKCMNCSAMGYAEKFPEKTVFDHITASPEVLAPHFVYRKWSESKGCWDWYSTIIKDNAIPFKDKSEAYTATVAKLKEVAE